MNFKLSELIHSDTAVKYNINNMPDIDALDNMLDLIVYCLQPLRDKIGKPIIITSGYRNKLVNQLVKGSPTSDHTKGMAVDFIIKGMPVSDIVDIIQKSDIKFTQLIEEYSVNSSWVHISYNPKNLKREVLLCKNGRYIKT